MSNADEIADKLNNNLREAINNSMAEKAKELLSEKDPTIDWSIVRIVSNLEDSDFYMETDDPETEAKIQAAYELIKAD